jgi:hypothetical protein
MNDEARARAGDAPASGDLHRRVRAFIDASVRGDATAETFDTLGLAIARHQAAHVAPYRRLLSSSGCDVDRTATVRELPAVPTEVFRLARLAAHAESDDVAVFRTSGTTSGARGEHALSTTATYEAGALAWGKWGLFFDESPALTAIALTLPPDHFSKESSLHFMIQLFSATFAKRATFLQRSNDALIEPAELVSACTAAARAGHPAIVMGASFAFVHLLDALRGERLTLPAGSRVMHTGGFKGRSREVAPADLLSDIATAFSVPEHAVVGEYGMTELSSQLYEPTLRAARGLAPAETRHGVFIAPPWLRVVAVDPDTLRPLADGTAGILRFEDLANVDSAIAVQTADRGVCRAAALGSRMRGTAVELLGRLPGATPRGCSLAIDELMRAT